MTLTLDRPSTVSFASIIATALDQASQATETLDVVAVSGLGAGRYGTGSMPDIWQVITETGPRLYVVDTAVKERLSLFVSTARSDHSRMVPVCHLRVTGVRFKDMAGYDSFLVSALVEDPDYLGVTGLASDTITALAAQKPVDKIDALLIVAHETARAFCDDCELSREERVLTFNDGGLHYRLAASEHLLALMVTEGSEDGADFVRAQFYNTLSDVEADLIHHLGGH